MSTARSATGLPQIVAIFREVWADQIDNHGEPCPVCQTEGQDIECNVYVPLSAGEAQLLSTCLCCCITAALDAPGRSTDRDLIIEFSGGDRK